MRSGWVGGVGAASGTVLLLVAAAMIVQPNVRVLEETFDGWLDGWGEDEPQAEASVDRLTVEAGRVSGRVRNLSAVALGRVDVTVRLDLAGGGSKTERASVYALAPGGEAWFGIPLVGISATGAEVLDVQATAVAGESTPGRTALPRTPRRGGVGGMQDVERFEREMKQMEEATRAATGG